MSEVAAILKVHPQTVRQALYGGELRCYRIGGGRGAIRIGDRHLREYLSRCESSVR